MIDYHKHMFYCFEEIEEEKQENDLRACIYLCCPLFACTKRQPRGKGRRASRFAYTLSQPTTIRSYPLYVHVYSTKFHLLPGILSAFAGVTVSIVLTS